MWAALLFLPDCVNAVKSVGKPWRLTQWLALKITRYHQIVTSEPVNNQVSDPRFIIVFRSVAMPLTQLPYSTDLSVLDMHQSYDNVVGTSAVDLFSLLPECLQHPLTIKNVGNTVETRRQLQLMVKFVPLNSWILLPAFWPTWYAQCWKDDVNRTGASNLHMERGFSLSTMTPLAVAILAVGKQAETTLRTWPMRLKDPQTKRTPSIYLRSTPHLANKVQYVLQSMTWRPVSDVKEVHPKQPG